MTPEPDRGAVTHIAGLAVRVGCMLRQRCAWCGAVLADYDLACLMVPEGQDPMPGTWEPGGLVAIDGPVSRAVPHEDGAELPEDSCTRIDPAVTA